MSEDDWAVLELATSEKWIEIRNIRKFPRRQWQRTSLVMFAVAPIITNIKGNIEELHSAINKKCGLGKQIPH